MKMIVVFAAVLAIALAAPIDDSKDAQILRYENDNIGVDGYKFSWVTNLILQDFVVWVKRFHFFTFY